MDMDMDMHISVVTSGDLVWEGLTAAAAPPFADLGLKCTVRQQRR